MAVLILIEIYRTCGNYDTIFKRHERYVQNSDFEY